MDTPELALAVVFGVNRRPTGETAVCSYTVTHGLSCCWHADERPSEWIVTLGDERGRCEHYVCDECAYAAAKGALPEQHTDQDFISMRVRRVPSQDEPPTASVMADKHSEHPAQTEAAHDDR
jgi:hypothetical protein